VPSLQELEERRAYECRLTPDRALRSLDEAEEWVRERGLVTRTPDSALPSLFEACQEEPYRPGSGGFAEWPKTKWWWPGALAEREGISALKIHRGKTLLVGPAVTAILDPICRAELGRMEEAEQDWARLLGFLADAGPTEAEDVRTALGLTRKELKDARSPLERCGALVSRQLVLETSGGGHLHTSELARWDQVFPEPASGPGGLEELIAAGVRAAVVAPEREVGKWFSWSWRFSADLVERLVAAGRIERPEPGWLAAPASA
jgi:hypothetical protein